MHLFYIQKDFLEDWEDCLIKLGVPMAISPLHDKDVSERKFEDMNDNEKRHCVQWR